MSGSSGSNVGIVGICWDVNHHLMAVLDNHPACRSCMRKPGQTCSSTAPSGVCRSGHVELWFKVRQAELCLAKRRIDQAEAHLSGAKACSGKCQTSLPRIGDGATVTSNIQCDPRIMARAKDKAWPRFEAPSGSVAQFKIPQLAPATYAANHRDGAMASQGGALP